MSGTYSSLVRNTDRQIANEANDRSLMCKAHGCPNLWSCDFGEKLCSAHAYSPPHDWPRITETLRTIETERALRNGRDMAPQRPASKAEIKSALLKLKGIGMGIGPTAVLEGLRRRASRGKLGRAQREFLEHLEERFTTPRKDEA